MTNHELLEALIYGEHDLTPVAREAFTKWFALGEHPLTAKQQAWLRDVAEKKGLIGDAGAANIFSAMSPKKQAEQRARAAKVKLPWER